VASQLTAELAQIDKTAIAKFSAAGCDCSDLRCRGLRFPKRDDSFLHRAGIGK
jgi:hypothetical protein